MNTSINNVESDSVITPMIASVYDHPAPGHTSQ